MSMLVRTFVNCLVLVIAIGLTACSSGGDDGGGAPPVPNYNGASAPAAIDADNAEDIGTTATEASSEAINSDSAGGANPFFPGGVSISNASSADINRTVAEIAKQLADNATMESKPLAATFSYTELGDPNFCGGSFSVPDSVVNSQTVPTSFTITFNNICYDAPNDGLSQMIMNGQIQYSETSNGITIRYINFTVTMDGRTETLNFTMTCDFSSVNGCSYVSDYVGSDGKTYRMENFSVTGSDSTGYNVSATFYHPDYGSVDITTTTPILFNCAPNPQPGSGSLTFMGANGTSGSITFDSCTSYTYCYDDGVVASAVCNTGMW